MKIIPALVNFSLLFAAVINIPDDYPTIQGGIDASEDGDTVLVQPGVYVENILISHINIVLGSLFITTQDTGYISQTIIDGNQMGSVVTIEGVPRSCRLVGFTITNGDAYAAGGGINAEFSSFTVEWCTIKNNTANMTCLEGSVGVGGGIWIYGHCRATIKYSVIQGNESCANWAWNTGWAGGMLINDSHVTMDHVLIADNLSGCNGGIGMMDSQIDLIHCTLSGNYSITDDCSNGDEIYSIQSTINLYNSIVWGNSEGDIVLSQDYNPSVLNASYSNIYGGEEGIITIEDSQVNWLEGNINSSPLFTDPENGDYHLQPDSPCIDAGDPDSPLDPDGTIADMGAYYYNQNPDCCEPVGDLNCDGNVNILDIVFLVGCILETVDDPACECGDLNGDLFVDVLDIVILINSSLIPPGDG